MLGRIGGVYEVLSFKGFQGSSSGFSWFSVVFHGFQVFSWVYGFNGFRSLWVFGFL